MPLCGWPTKFKLALNSIELVASAADFERSDRPLPLIGTFVAISVGSVTVAGKLFGISLSSVMPMSTLSDIWGSAIRLVGGPGKLLVGQHAT